MLRCSHRAHPLFVQLALFLAIMKSVYSLTMQKNSNEASQHEI